MSAIYLIGYRCTGKSTIGKLVADLMDRDFIDTDRIIEEQFQTTIEKMVSQRGWDYFRQKEKEVLFDSVHISNPVVATGGGIVMDTENRNFIQSNGVCVWLYADYTTIVQRIIADRKNQESRPSLTSPSHSNHSLTNHSLTNHSLTRETLKMLEIRNPLYEKLGLIKIDTSSHSLEQAANIIKRRFPHVRQ